MTQHADLVAGVTAVPVQVAREEAWLGQDVVSEEEDEWRSRGLPTYVARRRGAPGSRDRSTRSR